MVSIILDAMNGSRAISRRVQMHAKDEKGLIQRLDRTHASEYNPSEKVHGGLSDTQLISENGS